MNIEHRIPESHPEKYLESLIYSLFYHSTNVNEMVTQKKLSSSFHRKPNPLGKIALDV